MSAAEPQACPLADTSGPTRRGRCVSDIKHEPDLQPHLEDEKAEASRRGPTPPPPTHHTSWGAAGTGGAYRSRSTLFRSRSLNRSHALRTRVNPGLLPNLPRTHFPGGLLGWVGSSLKRPPQVG